MWRVYTGAFLSYSYLVLMDDGNPCEDYLSTFCRHRSTGALAGICVEYKYMTAMRKRVPSRH